jgi:hypothetical protein
MTTSVEFAVIFTNLLTETPGRILPPTRRSKISPAIGFAPSAGPGKTNSWQFYDSRQSGETVTSPEKGEPDKANPKETMTILNRRTT